LILEEGLEGYNMVSFDYNKAVMKINVGIIYYDVTRNNKMVKKRLLR